MQPATDVERQFELKKLKSELQFLRHNRSSSLEQDVKCRINRGLDFILSRNESSSVEPKERNSSYHPLGTQRISTSLIKSRLQEIK